MVPPYEDILKEYSTTARRVGLTTEQTQRLLVHADQTARGGGEYYRMIMITRILQQSKDRETDLLQNFDLFMEVVGFGALEHVSAFFHATRLGLSTSQSHRLIEESDEVHKIGTIYNYFNFIEALDSLYPAKVDPDLVVRAMRVFYDLDAWAGDSNLTAFSEMMTLGAPHRFSVNTMLAHIAAIRERGIQLPQLSADDAFPESTSDSVDSFFELDARTPLENARQPYKKRAGFHEGVRDLDRLVHATPEYRDIAEGLWIFDPKSETWFSLGGRTELVYDRSYLKALRHRFRPYDISKLSDEPIVVHIHPEYYESDLSPPENLLTYPEYKHKLTKFQFAIASRSDYRAIAELMKVASRPVKPRVFIKHSVGGTEIEFPNSISALETMAEESRNYSDDVLVKFDVEAYHRQRGNMETDQCFVGRLMLELNKRLPEGFGLSLRPSYLI